MDKLIRLTNGTLVKLEKFQESNGLPDLRLSRHFAVAELDCNGELEIAAPLLRLLDHFRDKLGQPVKINSGYRSVAKQKALKAAGFKAATISPHCFGMAADVDARNKAEVLQFVKLLKGVADELKIKVRLGFNQYLQLGLTFVHVDVCPEFYAKGKPLHHEPHPLVWENEIQW